MVMLGKNVCEVGSSFGSLIYSTTYHKEIFNKTYNEDLNEKNELITLIKKEKKEKEEKEKKEKEEKEKKTVVQSKFKNIFIYVDSIPNTIKTFKQLIET